MITEEQWNRYDHLYGKLILMIAHRISGDIGLCSVEDNVANLQLAALNSIKGFTAKTGKTVDECFEDPLFDKYTKTVLWNCKNKIGKKITERNKSLKFVNISSMVTDVDYTFDFVDPSGPFNADSIFKMDFNCILHEDNEKYTNHRRVAYHLLHDNDVFGQKGFACINSIKNNTNISLRNVQKAMDKLRKLFKDYDD